VHNFLIVEERAILGRHHHFYCCLSYCAYFRYSTVAKWFCIPLVGRLCLCHFLELELELIQTQMAQKPMLRAEVGMRVRCANKASVE